MIGENAKLYLVAILDLFSRFVAPAAPAFDPRPDQSGRLRATRTGGMKMTVGCSVARHIPSD